MTQTLKIVCDQCNRDLSSMGGQDGWRLYLASEPVVPAVYTFSLRRKPEPVVGSKHFCGVQCLAQWSAAKLEDRP